MGRKRVTWFPLSRYRRNIYHSLGQPFLPPSFFFCLPDSREPSFLAASSSPTVLHLASLSHPRYICIPVLAYHLVLPVPLFLPRSVVHQSFFFPSFFPPHRDFQLALACCSPFTRCVFFFLFLTLTILYFSASVSMFVFSAHA